MPRDRFHPKDYLTAYAARTVTVDLNSVDIQLFREGRRGRKGGSQSCRSTRLDEHPQRAIAAVILKQTSGRIVLIRLPIRSSRSERRDSEGFVGSFNAPILYRFSTINPQRLSINGDPADEIIRDRRNRGALKIRATRTQCDVIARKDGRHRTAAHDLNKTSVRSNGFRYTACVNKGRSNRSARPRTLCDGNRRAL